MALPSNDLKNPTFYSTISIFISVANKITPNILHITIFYVMKIGEKTRKNLPESILFNARYKVPPTPNTKIATLTYTHQLRSNYIDYFNDLNRFISF